MEKEGWDRHEKSGCCRSPGEEPGYWQEQGRSQEEERLSSWVEGEDHFWEEPQEGLSLEEEGQDRHEGGGRCRWPGEEWGYRREEVQSYEEEGGYWQAEEGSWEEEEQGFPCWGVEELRVQLQGWQKRV